MIYFFYYKPLPYKGNLFFYIIILSLGIWGEFLPCSMFFLLFGKFLLDNP
ncbi:hypothetical protein BACOVA_00365 [Bacteroides ovatus ATCC 8483]|uniref:Uncharacterized protein n=1 Tax=Bacteroides ovatus (strain ATCC 8483 / DSM 1896 / JCM 5824 / BCRC 10623 / CCUG 4943 / NCTC 11153) TaxID=411476 RepID=A0AAN3DAK8_BACO1|nr:hypothetical protein BACOVA_00365 [Bacteroides ovatus ATCC 8483]